MSTMLSISTTMINNTIIINNTKDEEKKKGHLNPRDFFVSYIKGATLLYSNFFIIFYVT